MANKFDTVPLLSNAQQDKLDSTLKLSMDSNPEEAARAAKAAQSSGLPLDTVERNLSEVEKNNRFKSVPRLDDSPETRRFLTSQENAKQAHDDIEQLQGLERGFFDNTARRVGERTTELTGQLVSFMDQVSRFADEKMGVGNIVFDEDINLYDMRTWVPSYDPRSIKQLESAGMKNVATAAAEGLQATEFDAEHIHTWESVKRAFTDSNTGALSAMGEVLLFAGEQGIASVPDMVAVMANLPVYVLSRSAEIGGERAANKGKDQDITDTLEALPFALGAALLEKAPIPGMLNAGSDAVEAVGKEALKQAMGDIAKAGAKEGGTEFLQEGVIEYLGARLGTGAELDAAEAAESGLAGLVSGGVFGSAVATGSASTRAVVNKIHERRLQGANDAEKMSDITQRSAKVQLKDRNSSAFKQFVNKLGEAYNAETVYIDPDGANTFFQAAQLPESAVESEAVQEIIPKLAEALETGTPIEVPIEVYVASVAGTELEGLNAHVTLSPDSMTPAQSQEQSILDEINEAIEAEPSTAQEGRLVYDDLMGMVTAMGWDASRAQTEAARVSAMMETLSKRTGKPVKALWQKYGPGVQNEIDPLLKARAKAVEDVDIMLDRIRSGDIPAPGDVFGESLLPFIRKHGGLIDDGGELAASDIRGLTRKQGRSLDDMAEAAVEAGFIQERSEQALLDAIRRENDGDPVYMLGKENQQKMQTRDQLNELSDILEMSELDPTIMTNEEIKNALLSPDPLGRDVLTQDLGDTKIEQEFEVAETGKTVKIRQSAQKLFDQTAKRVNILEKLKGCVNG